MALWLVSGVSSAQSGYWSGPIGTARFATAQASCQSSGPGRYVTDCTATSCKCRYPEADGSGVIGNTLFTSTPDAPPNPEVCSSQTPFRVKQTVPASIAGTSSMTLPTSAKGCNIKVNEVITCYKLPKASPPDSNTYCEYIVTNFGGPVSSAPGPGDGAEGTASIPPDTAKLPILPFKGGSDGTCPAGSSSVGQDSSGITICAGTGTDTTPLPPPPKVATPVSSTTASDGTKTVTSSESTQNVDGSVTTKTTVVTTAPNGVSTTAVSMTTSAASLTNKAGTADKPADPTDFCQKNPNSPVCKPSSVSGSCAAVTCSGDAIQCATLRAAATIQCKQQADSDEVKNSSLASLGTNASNGVDPLSSTFPKISNATLVQAPSSLDQASWIGAGSCFKDKTFVIAGHSVVIPFSKTCDYLLALRYALMAVAALVSFKIISRAVLT